MSYELHVSRALEKPWQVVSQAEFEPWLCILLYVVVTVAQVRLRKARGKKCEGLL